MKRPWECWYCIHIALLTPAQLTCKPRGPVLQRTATCTPCTTQTPFYSFHNSTLDCLLGSSSSAEKTKVLKQYAELTAMFLVTSLGNKMFGYVVPFQNLRVVLITQQAHTSEKSLQDFTNPKFPFNIVQNDNKNLQILPSPERRPTVTEKAHTLNCMSDKEILCSAIRQICFPPFA